MHLWFKDISVLGPRKSAKSAARNRRFIDPPDRDHFLKVLSKNLSMAEVVLSR
jgi:hypothetical protein